MSASVRRSPGSDPFVIAHRGASARAPENTMAAFRSAWAAGATWLEADVQPSADGIPVLLHDDTVDRTTDGSGPVRDLTIAQLRALDAGSWFPASHAAPPGAFAGERIPSLADLLAELGPGRCLLLEIKGPHTPDQLSALLAVVEGSGADHRVMLQSFELDALWQVRELRPERPLGMLVEELADDPVAACRELGAMAYNPPAGLVSGRPDLVRELHTAGIAMTPWTADESAEWALLVAAGVDGVITNRPGELLAWLGA